MLIDRAFVHLAPVVHRREVQEGITDFEKSNPEILVLGSSHGRTFHILGQELSRVSNGAHSLVSIPLEYGKLSAYAWLLDNRVVPLLDAPTEQGGRKRANLRRFIILTEWWDSCHDKSAGWNLPSRAWTFRYFAADVIEHGMSSYNRNYLQSQWRRLFWNSALVQDRGFDTLLRNVQSRLRHRPMGLSADEYQQKVATWQKMVENGVTCLGSPAEMAGLSHLLQFGQQRTLDTTIVLFPRKPDTLTDEAKKTTLQSFREKVLQLAQPFGARVIDLTTSTPLESSDFMDDFDHVNAEGNKKFAKWALAGPMGFLLQPRPSDQVGAP